MECSLRKVAFSDLTELVREAVDSAAFLPLKGDEGPFLLSLPRLFEGHPDYHLFVLDGDGERGMGFVVTMPRQEAGTVSIGPMYVRERYRGRGWGRRLVACLVEWARIRGVKRLFAQTWGRNVASRRIFEGLGFRCVGEVADSRVNGDSTVKYLLRLNVDKSQPGETVSRQGGTDGS